MRPAARPARSTAAGFVRFGADRHEFVAARARQEGVGGRDLHAARDVEQHAVAGGMAVEVVDLLEAVEIDAQHGEFLAASERVPASCARRWFSAARFGRSVSGS